MHVDVYRYAIPLVQKILDEKSRPTAAGVSSGRGGVRALVLVPSKELAEQASRNIRVSVCVCVFGGGGGGGGGGGELHWVC